MSLRIRCGGGARRVLSWLAVAAAAGLASGPFTAKAACPAPATLGAVVVGQYGSIKGRVVWGGEGIPQIKVLEEKGKADKDPQVCARDKPIFSRELVVDPATKGVSYAFAYLVRPKGENATAVQQLLEKQPAVVLDQQNCEFLPYVLAMHEKQKLVVKSSDAGTNHNVHLNGFNNSSNQNVAAGTELKLDLVPEKLPIAINCDIHPWMKAYVMVFDHPFFATTGKDGSFEIKGVPAGKQNLVLWQETVGFVNKGAGRGMPVEVKADEATDLGEIKLVPKK
ncbi:MAG: cupredoxin domain-containing protein [Isosphaeraceae bacterium]